VTVDKPLTLRGQTPSDLEAETEIGATESGDCFDPAASAPNATEQAIVDPAGDGFSIAVKLNADDVAVEGLVVQGASVGIDASDRFSGYRIHHDLIRLNSLFGIDFGSEGTAQSRVDHNCLRQNQYGLVSELDDDTLSTERDAWNARDLRNARLDHNDTFRNGSGCCGAGLEAGGPGRRDQVTFDHNLAREEWIGIALQNATRSSIVENEISSSRFFSILLGGANDALEIRSNTVRGGGTGVLFAPEQFTLDLLATPSRNVLVSYNDVRRAAAGIYARPASLVASVLSDNTTSENRGNGINMFSTGNVIRDNQSNNNVVAGITAFPGAIGNRFEHNSMHGNGSAPGASFPPADARDLNPLLNGTVQNDWIGNDCDTDIPIGMICGLG